MGPKRTKLVAATWEEQKAIKEVMVYLQGVGASTSLAVWSFKKYRDDAISVVRRERYQLAADVRASGSRPLTPSPRRWVSRMTTRNERQPRSTSLRTEICRFLGQGVGIA